MRFLIDTGIIPEIEIAYGWGMVQGVTTNPSLIKKYLEDPERKGMTLHDYFAQLLQLVDRYAKDHPVSLEVVGFTYDDMLNQGLALYERFSQYHPQGTYIKVPVNPSMSNNERDRVSYDGLRVIRALSEQGIPVNCTLINNPEQGVAASIAGAKLLSPFAGRIDDMIRTKAGMKFDKSDYFPADGIADSNGEKLRDDNGIVSGVDLVRVLVAAKRRHNLKSDVLAASIRNTIQLQECAYICNSDIVTIPFYIIEDMRRHEIRIEKEAPQDFRMKRDSLMDSSSYDTTSIDIIVEEGIEKYPQALYHPKTAEGMTLFTKDAEALKDLYSELFASAA